MKHRPRLMIVRGFLTLFRLIIAPLALITSGMAQSAVGAGQIKAAADHFLVGYSRQLQQRYGDDTRVEYTIDRLDNRLSMADCPVALSARRKSIREVGRINVQVQCDSKVRWTLYVPANIRLYRKVVTLTGPVSRGQALSAADLELREVDTATLTGNYFTDVKEAVGMVARRLLRADRPLIASSLKPAMMVHKGDAVILTANSGGLTVKMPGVALRDGGEGEQISVRNTQSKRVVEAEVTGPGQVQVPM